MYLLDHGICASLPAADSWGVLPHGVVWCVQIRVEPRGHCTGEIRLRP